MLNGQCSSHSYRMVNGIGLFAAGSNDMVPKISHGALSIKMGSIDYWTMITQGSIKKSRNN
jgi:hypothetical protein